MFDEKFKSQYDAIKAPDELYDRIIGSQSLKAKPKSTAYKKIGTLAAVLAVCVISCFVLMTFNSYPKIYVDGEKLSEKALTPSRDNTAVMLARAEAVYEYELKLKTKKGTVITVENGSLTTADGEIFLLQGESAPLDTDTVFIWSVPTDSDSQKYSIKLELNEKTYYIELSFDENGAVPVLRLK